MSQSADAEPALPHPFFGKSIARCKVGERIGRGRTSSVCRAHYEPLGQDIALKILYGDLATQLRDSFTAEARAIAKLDHENIVRVLDVVEDQECTCILMEYVQGDTLQDLINELKVVPPARALRIALQMARALEAAHAEKVVHRDVKPGNVMLADAGNTVKMVDFGLAGQKTMANRAGTPLYMSPEACQGKRIDEKSDIYALGICLYQMLTGALPFTGKSVKEILKAHVNAEYIPPSKARPPLGDKYDDIIKKLLVASKGYRPSATEAAKMLEALVAESTPGKARGGKAAGKGGGGRRRARGSAAASSSKESGMPPAAIAAIVGGVVVVIALLAFMMSGNGDDKRSSDASKTTATDPTGGGISSNGTTEPVVKPPPGKSLDQQAYDAAYTKTKEAENPQQGVVAWEWFLEKNPDSPLVEKAQKHLETAKAAVAQAKRDNEFKQAAEERKEKDAANRKRLADKVREYDFKGAEFVARSLRQAEGQSRTGWKTKRARLEFLAEQFLERMNSALEANQPSAQILKPDVSELALLVGTTPQGIVMAEGSMKTELAWKDLAPFPKGIYEVCTNLFSVRSIEDQLFMAILCKELGLEKESKSHQVGIEVLDPDAPRTLERYFEAK